MESWQQCVSSQSTNTLLNQFLILSSRYTQIYKMSSCAAIPQTSGGCGGCGGAVAATATPAQPISAAELIASTRARLAASATRLPVRESITISRIPVTTGSQTLRSVEPLTLVTCGCISCKRGKPIHCVVGLAAGGGGGPVTGPQTYYVETAAEAERVRAGRRLVPLTETLACYLLNALAGPSATENEREDISDEIDAMYTVVKDPAAAPEEDEEDEEDDEYEDPEDEEERMKEASEHINDLWEDFEGFIREESSHRALRRILLAYVNDSYCARLLLKKPSRNHAVGRLRSLVTRGRFLDSIHSEQSCAPGQPWVQSAPLNSHAWKTFQERLEQIKRWPGYEA